MRVNVATTKGARDANNQKAGTTTILDRPQSGSPAPNAAGSPSADGAINGRRGSVASATSTGATGQTLNSETARTKRERTIALLNVPDTVSDARIKAILEPHGALRKIIFRRDKGGALVEFIKLEDAGKAGMGLDLSSLGPDCRVGEADELMGKRGNGSGPAEGAARSFMPMRPVQAGVSRPAQRGGRRGGGLGFKRGGLGSGASRKVAGADTEMGEGDVPAAADGGGGVKSNADFRAMFVKSGEVKDAEKKEAEAEANGKAK